MKKKNLVATLAILAISAVPLMAYQLENYNIDEELTKEVKASIQENVTVEQQQNDAIVSAKYERVTNDFNNFMNLMQNKSLANMSPSSVGQTIFRAIDDLAQSILDLPEPSRDIYVGLFASASSEERPLYFHFAYENYQEKNLNALFDLATAYLPNMWLDGNFAIEKLLETQIPNLQDKVRNWKPSEYDNAFLEVVSSRMNESEKVYLSYIQQLDTEFNKTMETLTALLDNDSLKANVDNQNDPTKRQYAIQAVKQDVFTSIDNAAKAILAFPQGEKALRYESLVQTLAEHEFKYLGKHLTLQELFDFASTGGIYYDDNTPIQKLLNETRVVYRDVGSVSFRSGLWERFIEDTVIRPAKTK